MFHARLPCTSALLSPLPAAFAADEGGLHQIRLTLQGMPTEAEIDSEASAGSFAVSDGDEAGFDDAGRLSVGYWYASNRTEPVAFSLGAGLDVTGLGYDQDGVEAEIGQAGLFIEPGVALRANRWLSFELAPRFGVGSVRTDLKVDGEEIDVDDTAYGEASLRARAIVRGEAGWQFYLEAGYLHQAFTYETDGVVLGTSYEAESEYTLSGGFFGLGFGWDF